MSIYKKYFNTKRRLLEFIKVIVNVDVMLLIVSFLIFNQSSSWDGYTVTLEKACIVRLNAQVDSTGWVSERRWRQSTVAAP